VTRRIVIIGAGGHAISAGDVVLSALCAGDELCGFLAPEAVGTLVLGSYAVIGSETEFPRLIKELSLTHYMVGIGSISGNAHLRRELFIKGRVASLLPFSAIHPSAVVSKYAHCGAGTVVMAGACINAKSKIGENVIINTGAVIDHEADIGDHVHIGPGAVLSGGITIGAGAHVGVGSVIKHGVSVGDGATVGAGSVVLKDVQAGATVVGVPAKPLSGKS
jgi:UDP-perosamine 4-acetyltransferase